MFIRLRIVNYWNTVKQIYRCFPNVLSCFISPAPNITRIVDGSGDEFGNRDTSRGKAYRRSCQEMLNAKVPSCSDPQFSSPAIHADIMSIVLRDGSCDKTRPNVQQHGHFQLHACFYEIVGDLRRLVIGRKFGLDTMTQERLIGRHEIHLESNMKYEAESSCLIPQSNCRSLCDFSLALF